MAKNARVKCEITLLEAKKNAKVKCEITRIKAKKRERQMRNNANISIIPNITLYACTSNHDNQFHIVNCLNNLYDMIL